MTRLSWKAAEQRQRVRQQAIEAAALLGGLLMVAYFWLCWAVYGELP